MKKVFTLLLSLFMVITVTNVNVFADELGGDANITIEVIGNDSMTDGTNVDEEKADKEYNVNINWSNGFKFTYKFNQNQPVYDPNTLTYTQATDDNEGWYVGDEKGDSIAFSVTNKSNDSVIVTPEFKAGDAALTGTTALEVNDDTTTFANTAGTKTSFTMAKASVTEIGTAGTEVTKNLKMKVSGIPDYATYDKAVRARLHLEIGIVEPEETEIPEDIDLNNITNLTGLAWKGNNKMQVHSDATYDVTFTTHDLNGTEVNGKALEFNSGYGQLMFSQLDQDDYWYSLMQFIAEDDNHIVFNNALGVQYGSWTSNDNDYTPTSELNQQQETPSQGNPTTGGTAGGAAGGKTSATISLYDARMNIATCIESATTMQSTVAGLSAEDQKQFTADVIKAINDMPASLEEKTATVITASIAAIKGASDGNVATILAEVFACANPASLPIIVEVFASSVFNVAADPNAVYTDTQLATVATNTLKTIDERCTETDYCSVRTGFAAIMLELATNNRLSGISLVSGILTGDAYDLATTDWIPDAIQGNYESILASADAGKRPDKEYTLVVLGPLYLNSYWDELSSKNTDQMSIIGGRSPVLDAVDNPLIHQNPVIGGGGQEVGPPGEDPRPTPEEPEPYPGQRTLPSSMINETAWYKLAVYPSGMEGSEKCDGYIYFTGGEDATNSELITWLQANGTFSIPNAE